MIYILCQMFSNKAREVKTNQCLRFQTGLTVRIVHTFDDMTRLFFNEDPTKFQVMTHQNEVFIANENFVNQVAH